MPRAEAQAGIESIDNLVGPRGTTEQVAERIRDAIVSGRISPGTWLREAKLADRLGVSRIPVREALAPLEAEGFVKRVPYRGTKVVRLTVDQVIESFMLRSLLEGFATRMATPHLTPEEVTRLGDRPALRGNALGVTRGGWWRRGMRPNKVKRALMKGEVQIGTWVNALRTPQIAQMIATAGFDFMYIDMEHSSFSIETAGDLCFAALAAGLVPIVRPAAKEPHLLTRPLDNGAMGLLKIPGLLVQDVASAKKWIAKGIRLVPYANEVSLLVNAGARAVGEIRGFSKGGG